ncbi:MAG: hypothetical protein AB1689_12420 [Thermodesulfobacteriota bacterium]
MLLMETAGHDLIRCELKLGLVVWRHDSPTPSTLEGYGHRNYKLVHADEAERRMLEKHGIKLEELELKNVELHQRVPTAQAKARWKKWKKERTIYRQVNAEVRARLRAVEKAESQHMNGGAVNGAEMNGAA